MRVQRVRGFRNISITRGSAGPGRIQGVVGPKTVRTGSDSRSGHRQDRAASRSDALHNDTGHAGCRYRCGGVTFRTTESNQARVPLGGTGSAPTARRPPLRPRVCDRGRASGWGAVGRVLRSAGTFDRLPRQYCRLLGRLSDHLASRWLPVPGRTFRLSVDDGVAEYTLRASASSMYSTGPPFSLGLAHRRKLPNIPGEFWSMAAAPRPAAGGGGGSLMPARRGMSSLRETRTGRHGPCQCSRGRTVLGRAE